MGHAAPTVTAPTASTGCRATFTDSRGGQQERILRYPDGNERRIIYPSYDDPAFQLQQQQQAAAASEALGHGRGAPVVDDDGDTYLVLEQEYLAWDECQLWGAACMSAASAPAEAPEFMRVRGRARSQCGVLCCRECTRTDTIARNPGSCLPPSRGEKGHQIPPMHWGWAWAAPVWLV